MKNFIYIVSGFALGIGLTAGAVFFPEAMRSALNKPESSDVITVSLYPNSATNTQTISIPRVKIHTLDGNYLAQGVCVKIKDADGSGFTYLTTRDGVGNFSKISCE